MPKSLDPQLWPLLAQNYGCRQTLAEWNHTLGSAGRKSVPLTSLKGERAEFIRCPETGIHLEIFENYDGSFSALPPADSELDSRIDGLALADLQLYEIDWLSLLSGLQQEFCLVGEIRILSYKPPFWHLGSVSEVSSYFSIVRSIEDIAFILPFIQSDAGTRLLLPSVSNTAFAELTKTGVMFQVLDSLATATIPDATPKKHSRYRIHEQPGGWQIVFAGKEASVGNLKGMNLIAHLLKNPPTAPVHILELESRVLPVPSLDTIAGEMETADDDESVGLSISDRLKEFNLNMDNADSNAALAAMLPGLKEKIADPETGGKDRALAEKTITEIQAFLDDGGPKHVDQASKAYERVRQQFIRLLKKLRQPLGSTGTPSPELVDFAEHLEEHLLKPSRRYSKNRRSRVKAGVAQTLTYEPPPGIAWTD